MFVTWRWTVCSLITRRVGDLAIGEPFCEETEHVLLAASDARERWVVDAAGRDEETTRPLSLGCRAELDQRIHGGGRLAFGYIGATQRNEARCELDPRPVPPRMGRRFARSDPRRPRAAAEPLRARPAPRRACPSARSARARSGDSSDQTLDLAERLEARRRLVELPARNSRTDEQFERRERGRASGAPVAGAAVAREARRRGASLRRRVPGGSAELCTRACTRLIEQQRGLIRLALAPSQVREHDQR